MFKPKLVAGFCLSVLMVLKAHADAPPVPADHGGDVAADLYTYKNDPTVPLHPPERPLAKLEVKNPGASSEALRKAF